jgi:RNA polymerase sigma factor (sigma-70 family)
MESPLYDRPWRRLSPDEERTLASRMQAGDLTARDRLLESVMAMVLRYAGRLARPGHDAGDLTQEGLLALLIKLPQFDPARGRLTTFAHQVLLTRMTRFRSVIDRTIRLPKSRPRTQTAWERASHIEALHERDPRFAESSPDLAERGEVRDQVTAALDALGPQVKEVLLRRAQGDELKDIGRDLGVTKQWVAQLELRGRIALRKQLAGVG